MSYIACIGKFDGVHLGHQRLIDKTIQLAKENGCQTMAITFDMPNKASITTLQEKEDLLYSYGIEEIMCFTFDDNFKMLSADLFIELFLNKSDIKYLVCGPDFTFGHNKVGDVKYLKEYKNKNFEVVVVEQLNYEDIKISSNWILKLIQQQDYQLVKKLIGRENIRRKI